MQAYAQILITCQNKITITWQQCGSTLTVHIHSDIMGQRLQEFGSYHYKDCKNMVATIGDLHQWPISLGDAKQFIHFWINKNHLYMSKAKEAWASN